MKALVSLILKIYIGVMGHARNVSIEFSQPLEAGNPSKDRNETECQANRVKKVDLLGVWSNDLGTIRGEINC